MLFSLTYANDQYTFHHQQMTPSIVDIARQFESAQFNSHVFQVHS